MNDDEEIKRFWQSLDALGEDEVRLRLKSGRVYGEQRAPYVEEWLHRKGQARSEARDRASDASQAEMAATASRAAEAAERAASAAERAAAAAEEQARAAERAARAAEAANMRATIAIVIASISAAATIIIPFLNH